MMCTNLLSAQRLNCSEISFFKTYHTPQSLAVYAFAGLLVILFNKRAKKARQKVVCLNIDVYVC